jgi:hypothetical protein
MAARRRGIMRWLAVLGVLMAMNGVTPLHAEDFPWCVELDVFTKNCAFTNHDECTTIAKNGGGRCIRNPHYQPPAAAAKSTKATGKPSAKPH